MIQPKCKAGIHHRDVPRSWRQQNDICLIHNEINLDANNAIQGLKQYSFKFATIHHSNSLRMLMRFVILCCLSLVLLLPWNHSGFTFRLAHAASVPITLLLKPSSLQNCLRITGRCAVRFQACQFWFP
ncbi:hypothetical protein Pelo_4232 [Pelomyxa schiedti]|nr:hypothetical protein Pelo_4232 [Pelomyxa schiedti]